MKQRVITGVLGALFGLAVLAFMFTPVLGIVIAAVSLLASYEIQHVAKIENKLLMIINIVLAAFMPFAYEYKLFSKLPFPTYVIAIVYVIIMMFIMLGNYKKTKFEDVVMSMFCGVIVPYVMSTITLLRNLCLSRPDLFQQSHVFFIIFTALLSAWLNDTFAYFVGRKFGKHKLAPNISPKKSVEGAIGGILFCDLTAVIIGLVFKFLVMPDANVNFWALILLGVIDAPVSILGDLSFSLIKRNYGIKDYGSIFPGHGGMLDRFDSIIFTAPVLVAINQFIPFITVG